MAEQTRITTIPPLLLIDGGAANPFVIQPKDISIKHHYYDAFDHHESEVSAIWIVQFCQQRGGWVPFSYQEIEDFYHEKSKGKLSGFTFNGLVDWKFINDESVKDDRGFIVFCKDGLYRVTIDFIARCYHAAPVIEEPQEAPKTEE